MLAASLLHALRGARRSSCSRALAAASAAWQRLQAGEPGPGAGSLYGSLSSGNRSWLSGASSFSGSSFSSSTVASDSKQASGIADSGSATKRRRPRDASGRFTSHTAQPQPQLQAWLQQKGLTAAEADQYARRLALVFGSQQAALAGLPAAFEWCRGQGLTGLQTAELLDRIAALRPDNVVQFAALVQPVWQLMDSYVTAWVQPDQQAGDSKLRKHTSLAHVLSSHEAAAQALGMPPGHVDSRLAVIRGRLPAAAIGKLLLSHPVVVTGNPSTASAALDWAAEQLGVTDPAAFFGGAPTLLNYEAPTLQHNLDSLQRTLTWPAEQTRQLVLKLPTLLASSPGTVRAALAWLRQLFPDAEQLAGIIDRGSRLLSCSVQHLQGNADYLRQELGWQDGDGQLAAFVAAHPHDYAIVNLSSEEMQHRLRLMSSVVGVSRQQCLTSGLSYLRRRLDNIAARYMLVQARVPDLLYGRSSGMSLSWIVEANKPRNLRRLGMTRPEFNAFVRQWPASEEGRRLLEGLRSGSVEGWPPPPSREEAQQRQQAVAEQQAQMQAKPLTRKPARRARKTAPAAAV